MNRIEQVIPLNQTVERDLLGYPDRTIRFPLPGAIVSNMAPQRLFQILRMTIFSFLSSCAIVSPASLSRIRCFPDANGQNPHYRPYSTSVVHKETIDPPRQTHDSRNRWPLRLPPSVLVAYSHHRIAARTAPSFLLERCG